MKGRKTNKQTNEQVSVFIFASYLSVRYKKVKLQGENSKWSDMRKGVLQGSVSGPLLFHVFVRHFYLIKNGSLYNYVDNNTLVNVFQIENMTTINWFRDDMQRSNYQGLIMIIWYSHRKYLQNLEEKKAA